MLIHPKGALRASVRTLRDGQELAHLPTTAHKPPKLLLPQCCELSHNQALFTASHQKDTNLNTPPPPSPHLLPYKKDFWSVFASLKRARWFSPRIVLHSS